MTWRFASSSNVFLYFRHCLKSFSLLQSFSHGATIFDSTFRGAFGAILLEVGILAPERRLTYGVSVMILRI